MALLDHPEVATDTLQPLLSKLEYRRRLSAEDRAAVLTLPYTVKRFEVNQYVVREYDQAVHSCLMLSGFSIRHKVVGDGARQIVAIHMRGEMVDLQNSYLGKADHSVQMLTAGKIAQIPVEAIDRLAFDRPEVGRALWIETLVDGSIFREWVANVGRRNAKTRIAHLLCEFSLRLEVAGLGHMDQYDLPMTQEQLADTTGLTPVHVNRSLKALEQEGLIKRSTPRSIAIGNWRKLADAGDFNSNYLHMSVNEPALA